MQFFTYEHLPNHLREYSEPFSDLANQLLNGLNLDDIPINPEVTAGLRKLLEAKDCFVRARLWKPHPLEETP
jgi:hypothetical protein